MMSERFRRSLIPACVVALAVAATITVAAVAFHDQVGQIVVSELTPAKSHESAAGSGSKPTPHSGDVGPRLRPEEGVVVSFTGPEEVVIPIGKWGLTNVPDTLISFLRASGEVRVWFTGARGTYFFEGETLGDAKPHQVDSEGDAVPVLTSSGAGFDRDYAGTGSVVEDNNSSDLLMFYHAEDYSLGRDCPYVSVGLARSSDGGESWRREGRVISSPEPPTPCPEGPAFQGAGSLSVVPGRDGYLYMYYMEWFRGGEHGVRLARAPVSSEGMPGSWVKYGDGGFRDEPGLGGASDLIIEAPDVRAGYAGVPSVSFNPTLDRYVAIVMGHNGFYYASSANMVDWDEPRLLWSVPALTYQSRLRDGEGWYYYPSLLSPGRHAQTTTGRTAYLYYARGTKNGPAHYMVRRPVRLDLSSSG